MRHVALTAEPIDCPAVLAALEDPASGALCSFVGRVRNNHDGKAVGHLEYSAHDEMALAQMNRIVDEMVARWRLTGVGFVHRIGRLEIGEVSVIVAVASGHRAESFEACRHGIETLKADVPIWKKEHYVDGEPRWIGAD